MASAQAVPALPAPRSDESFFGLPLCAFAFPGVTNIELYRFNPDKSGVLLVAGRKRGLAPNELADLFQRDVRTLLVRQVDYGQVTTALFNNLDLVAHSEKISVGERIVLVQAAVCDQLETAFQLLKPEAYIDLAQRVGHCLAGLIGESKLTAAQLFPVLQHGSLHAVHAMNTAIYAMQLGALVGSLSPLQRAELAVGALLHDLGLRRNTDLQGRPVGWASAPDYPLGEMHPRKAFETLCERSDISRAQLLMAYQHHEAVDGSGQPVGILADEIHPWARILTIVDRFDDMTSDRPGRPRHSISTGLANLELDAGTALDADMVACWMQVLRAK